MARITTRRPDEDEEELIEDESDEEEENGAAAPVMPAVSDSRRRRMMKRGETPVAEAEADDESPSGISTRKDRPTPSQRGEVVRSSNIVVRVVQDLDTYRKETWDELKKVTWLSREENIRLTYIVLIVTTASAIFLGLVSFLYGLLTQALASSASGVAAGVVVIVMIIAVAGAWLLRDRLFPAHYE